MEKVIKSERLNYNEKYYYYAFFDSVGYIKGLIGSPVDIEPTRAPADTVVEFTPGTFNEENFNLFRDSINSNESKVVFLNPEFDLYKLIVKVNGKEIGIDEIIETDKKEITVEVTTTGAEKTNTLSVKNVTAKLDKYCLLNNEEVDKIEFKDNHATFTVTFTNRGNISLRLKQLLPKIDYTWLTKFLQINYIGD